MADIIPLAANSKTALRLRKRREAERKRIVSKVGFEGQRMYPEFVTLSYMVREDSLNG